MPKLEQVQSRQEVTLLLNWMFIVYISFRFCWLCDCLKFFGLSSFYSVRSCSQIAAVLFNIKFWLLMEMRPNPLNNTAVLFSMLLFSWSSGPSWTSQGAILQIPDVPRGSVCHGAARRNLLPKVQLFRSGQTTQDNCCQQSDPVCYQKVGAHTECNVHS